MQAPQTLISTRSTFKTVPAVYLLLIKEDQILLSQRANTGYEDGNYGLVSGHVEANESLREAMAREVAEEIGLMVPIQSIDLALVMHRFAATSVPPERLDFFMCIEDWHGEPLNLEPAKCLELRWFNIHNLPDNVISYIKFALNEVTGGSKYCEYGWANR